MLIDWFCHRRFRFIALFHVLMLLVLLGLGFWFRFARRHTFVATVMLACFHDGDDDDDGGGLRTPGS